MTNCKKCACEDVSTSTRRIIATSIPPPIQTNPERNNTTSTALAVLFAILAIFFLCSSLYYRHLWKSQLQASSMALGGTFSTTDDVVMSHTTRNPDQEAWYNSEDVAQGTYEQPANAYEQPINAYEKPVPAYLEPSTSEQSNPTYLEVSTSYELASNPASSAPYDKASTTPINQISESSAVQTQPSYDQATDKFAITSQPDYSMAAETTVDTQPAYDMATDTQPAYDMATDPTTNVVYNLATSDGGKQYGFHD
eukprot:m.337253 g.337253  ORF g.337253 m.337253 type:complete len:253 (-) comp18085_c0_seq1:41-799(-)